MPWPGDKQLVDPAPFSGRAGVGPGEPSPASRAAGRFFWPGISVLFAASGCAALIYEIVWFQMLQLVIGSTAVSLGVLLASFMGGMCLGSVFVPRGARLGLDPLRLWALLELGIALLGLGVFFLMPGLARLYAGIVPAGLSGILIRGLFCSICLIPPTFLMGATLPTIGRLAPSDPRGASLLGGVYGANTLGAVAGSLLAGFFVLRRFDAERATLIAAAINATIAFIGLTLPLKPAEAPAGESMTSAARPGLAPLRSVWLYLTIALSGFCALGAEVVWTRLLSLLLGGTTYTFTIIVAVFLAGLASGSAAGSLLARQLKAPARALGLCQWLLVAAIAWAALMLSNSLPYWPINPLLSKGLRFDFQLDLLRCLWAILPATCLWGASFPLALAALAARQKSAALPVGQLYAANTLGAILGAVLCSVVLISWLGTRQTQRVLVGLSFLAGTLALVEEELAKARTRAPVVNSTLRTKSRFSRAGVWLGSAAVALLVVWTIPPVPWPLVAYGRYLPQKNELGRVLFVGEGRNASVAVTELGSGVRNFHVSGKIEASSDKQDMRLQRMLGHIPALFHPDPRSVLVVGCGAGVTAGSFLVHPGIERIRLCEIEPLIPQRVAPFFGEENYDVVQDRRVQIIYDDARHYIFTTRDRFDIITSDPIHPWVKGAASLYTKEYFELCKRHLNPGGMVTQWVPLYESDVATVKSEIATFFEVFPEGTIWSNENVGEGYDLVLLGQAEPLEVDLDTLQRRLSRSDHALVTQSLRDVGIRSAFGLAATYAGQARDLNPWLRNAQLNQDRDLRLQYLAGLGLNANESDFIYEQLSNYRRFPPEIFVGSSQWNEALKRALQQPQRKSP